MDEVTGGVVKVIEFVGSSPTSFSDAVRNTVKTASKTIRNIKGVDVLSSTAEVDKSGELINYKVHCKLAFVVEEPNSHEPRSSVGASAAVTSADRDEMAMAGTRRPAADS
ncbi:MAG TPA: dodecin family protein [Actinomycetota bacterium]|nr:dodecin family protein [Actinomycetota bacterium]